MNKFCATKKSHAAMYGIFLMTAIIILDQVVKYGVLHITIIETFCNKGIAMSIVLPQIVFIVLWGSIMAVVVYFWIKNLGEKFFVQIPLILILSGGVSNLVDRIYYGCVVDYIPFLNISHFNIADVFITVGAGLVLWQNFSNEKLKIKN